MTSAAETPILIAALQELGSHEHLCSIYQSQQEHFALALPFIRIGFERGEKCIYIADDDDAEGALREAMRAAGIDVERALETHALDLRTKEQACLKRGSFDPDRMLSFWEEAAERATDEGFSALRAVGEADWIVSGGLGLERWMEYESQLTDRLSAHRGTVLCTYDRRLFPPQLIRDVVRTHPIVAYRGSIGRNPYHVPLQELLGTDQTAREVERMLTSIRERAQLEYTLTQYVGTVIDIAERTNVEERLRSVQAELARAARVMIVGELAASIAHEVNQPLTAVIANGNAGLRWLAAASPRIDKAREALARIIRDGNRASDVIARVRALMRKARTESEWLDINAVIQDVLALMRRELRKNNVTLRTKLAADLPLAAGDRVQLQQVMLNLIMNGIEAMSTLADRPRELVIGTQTDTAGYVRITVRDSGIGLGEQSRERVFDAFYTTKPQGVGIGLSISRSIVEAHGGRLWVERNDGPGTTFQFTLPLHDAGAA